MMHPQGDMPKRRVSQAPEKFTTCFAGCGAQVTYRTNPHIICDACKPARRAEQLRAVAERMRRKRGVAAVKGTASVCSHCGATFVRNGIAAKYCPPCSDHIYYERARTASRRKRATEEGRKALNDWARQRIRNNPKWAISAHMRKLMHRGLGKGKAGKSWREFVPYTLDDLMRHLERQFLPGMTWDNRGDWHIDHIVPLASFKFETPDDPEFKAAWALTNLRPLWATDNIRKNAKRTLLV